MVWVPDWSLYIRIARAKLLSSRRCADAVILTGYTSASPGIGSHVYAVGENSTTYLSVGTTIPTCSCAPPPFVEGRDATYPLEDLLRKCRSDSVNGWYPAAVIDHLVFFS